MKNLTKFFTHFTFIEKPINMRYFHSNVSSFLFRKKETANHKFSAIRLPKTHIKYTSVNTVLVFFLILGGFFGLNSINAQSIPSSGGSPICSVCAPMGWGIDLGTPDISNDSQAAASGTGGGGATWIGAPLPLPPNGHTTWISLRDLGSGGAEEIVSTDMTGLTNGLTYEVTLYTLTARTNNDGQGGNPYSPIYNDEFRYVVGSNPIQTISSITQDVWGTTKFRFVASAAIEHLQLLPGNNSGGTFPTFESVQVSVTLNAIVAVPVAQDDAVSTTEDMAVNGDVFIDNGNGADQVGTGLITVTNFDANSTNGGTVNVNPEGTFTYTPLAGFSGIDTFTYEITDTNGNTDTATVSVTVNDEGNPSATDDIATVTENTTVPTTIDAIGNDDLTDNATYQAGSLDTTGTTGTVTDNGDGTFDYVPAAGFVGTDTFTYTICDDDAPTATCDTATVGVTVIPDTDNDGIPDAVDLDDDNDGIPDSVECPNPVGTNLIPDGDFGVADTANDTFFNGPGNGGGNPDNYNTYTKPIPASITTTYGYQAPRPTDGNYAVVTNSVGFSYVNGQPVPNFWLDIEDYTQDAPGELGYFALFNADGTAGTFFEQTISNLTIGEKYEFKTAIINLFNPGYLDNGTDQFLGQTPISPNFSMVVSDTGANIVAQFDSGAIPNDGQWKEISIAFTATATDMVLSIQNNTPGGIGNDFGIDGISLELVCDFDGDGIPNSLDLDSDNDGILDVYEAGGTDADRDGRIDDFVDVDGDGLNDAQDNVNSNGTNEVTNGIPLPTNNTDGNANDGPDFLDIDADDDGIVDNIEGQLTGAYQAPLNADDDQDGIDNQYDIDFVGSTPFAIENTDGDNLDDYRDLDSDDDGITDLIEGWDTDADGTPETIPLGNDFDNDGLDDAFDSDTTLPEPTGGQIHDSFPDAQQPGGNLDWRQGVDHDNDGIMDNVDLDDDNDGIPDADEGDGDTDGDGIPDKFDLDSDNDGVPDIIEAGGTDDDGDGLVDNFTDTDNDGLHDPLDNLNGGVSGQEVTNGTPLENPDSDDDGVDDRLDLDSDNDGIPDVLEAGGTDDDGDGVIDGFTDIDNDGFADSIDTDDNTVPGVGDGGTPLPDTNSDSDGIPNRLDVDSDNDGITDVTEAGGTDVDNDGRIDNFVDADGDGFADSVDTDDNTTPAALDGTGTPLPKDDFDEDGRPNYLDIDSDNDGITDATEAGGLDLDANGEIDGFTDTNGDGFDDATAASPLPIPNTDGNTNDGPDYLDIDADDDGLPDNIEAQPTATYVQPNGTSAQNGLDTAYTTGFVPEDTDGDLIPDYLDPDSDNDGIDDLTEGGRGTLTGVDTDGDGLDDGFEGADLNDPTDVNDEINDPTTLPDVQVAGGDVDYRQGLDSDGDGVLDDQEIADGTDSNDPCDYEIASITEPQGGNWLLADCDGDGVTNEQEIADNTNPEDSCDFNTDSVILALSGDYLISDCDGDGVTNGTEASDGTDPTDPCDFIEASVTLDRSGDWLLADCDGDQIPNGQELTDGTDSNDPCSSKGGTPPAGVPCDITIETDLVNPGVNEGIFRLTNIESYPNNTVKIYNRWGVLVFETQGYDNGSNAFRGISNGRATIQKSEQLPVGVYFYIIDYVNHEVASTKSGYLYVNR
ncbi:internalin, putative [hydrothermal vent metagenome]|uniref:Internalin, putative n=1 Tax=hydrothermal vent metagenome TaxID=652676 RepID=A0A3B0TUI9_9ZZZZ